MRVGISVLTHAGQSIWENGLGQHVYFMAQAIGALPFVRDLVFLETGEQTQLPTQVDVGLRQVRVMKPRDATYQLDVVIEMAGGLDVGWLDYMRAIGVRVAYHCCGQPYARLAEPIVFGQGAYAARSDRCDVVWLLPKDRRFQPMLEAMHRCPVIEVPYIWSPEFVDRRMAELAREGLSFGYERTAQQERVPLSVAIFEPNISVVKASAIPMLVCDEAYRQDACSVGQMHVLNSAHMSNHPTFNYLANSLDLVKAGMGRFEGRHDFPGYMARHANAVVSHQWQNDQNYLYLDALYGGYPLIHNSAWLGQEVGYFYPEFDIARGAEQLIRAAHHHDDDLDAYRTRANRFLANLAPLSEAHQNRYARLLLSLIGTKDRKAS